VRWVVKQIEDPTRSGSAKMRQRVELYPQGCSTNASKSPVCAFTRHLLFGDALASALASALELA